MHTIEHPSIDRRSTCKLRGFDSLCSGCECCVVPCFKRLGVIYDSLRQLYFTCEQCGHCFAILCTCRHDCRTLVVVEFSHDCAPIVPVIGRFEVTFQRGLPMSTDTAIHAHTWYAGPFPVKAGYPVLMHVCPAVVTHGFLCFAPFTRSFRLPRSQCTCSG